MTHFTRDRQTARTDSGATASYSNTDWAAVSAATVTIKGGTWPVGKLVASKSADAQNTALTQFRELSQLLASIHSDGDTTNAAKQRMSGEVLDAAADQIEPVIKALAEAWVNITERAIEGFDPVTALEQGDAATAIADAELRQVLREMDAGQRSKVIALASAGKKPAIANAVLRADPLASGVTDETADRLRGAGIVASHRDDLMTLRELSLVSFDAAATVRQVSESLVMQAKAGHHARLSKIAKGANPSAPFGKWLAELPEVPTHG